MNRHPPGKPVRVAVIVRDAGFGVAPAVVADAVVEVDEPEPLRLGAERLQLVGPAVDDVAQRRRERARARGSSSAMPCSCADSGSARRTASAVMCLTRGSSARASSSEKMGRSSVIDIPCVTCIQRTIIIAVPSGCDPECNPACDPHPRSSSRWPCGALARASPRSAQTLPAGPVSAFDGRLAVGAEVVATIGAEDDDAFFNYTDYEHNTLRMFRVALSASWRPLSRVAVVGEVRSEDLNRSRPYAAYVRVRPWLDHAFDIQVGRIPPSFGAFGRRGYQGSDNPLIGYPARLSVPDLAAARRRAGDGGRPARHARPRLARHLPDRRERSRARRAARLRLPLGHRRPGALGGARRRRHRQRHDRHARRSPRRGQQRRQAGVGPRRRIARRPGWSSARRRRAASSSIAT